MNGIFTMPIPQNEPVEAYAVGSEERKKLKEALDKIYNEKIEIPVIIGGKEIKTGNTGEFRMPSEHAKVLATYHKAGEKEIKDAVIAASEAKKIWANMPWVERASIALKAAELISTKYKYLLNAATMLGQSKNAYQAEIDSTAEIVDFLRFNAKYMEEIYSQQPASSKGIFNRVEYRPLEGFVLAVTPFNFTAIAGNLPTSPAIMGNVVLWKPATTAILSGYYLMKIFKEAGFPDGVINFIPGRGSQIGGILMNHQDLAGVHFTGSTGVFQTMWKTIGENIHQYKSYPRIVGETGGKDFIFAHSSAIDKVQEIAVAMVRGAYEYQGQKCSAASRAYIPKSIWAKLEGVVCSMIKELKMGCVRDFSNFVNAVIDEASFDNIMSYLDYAKKSDKATIIAGGNGDKSKGYFIEPTLIVTTDPHFKLMEEEIFGPVLTVFVYDDDKYEETLKLCDETSIYALTGALWSSDRVALQVGIKALENAAGNFYLNDKPTAAVVGQQPFGGARGSGTNDKAGSYLNLLRWTSVRLIKETFVAPDDYKYPFLEDK